MGRLFWKFLLAFLVSLLIAGAGVGTVVWLHNSGEQERTPPPGGPGGDTLIRSAAALLAQNENLRPLFPGCDSTPERSWQPAAAS